MARWLTTLAAAGALLLGCGATAYAAPGSPPVTNPDELRVRAGGSVSADVTANDKDPDGDQLEVCRLGPVPRALEASVYDGQLEVAASLKAHGTYTLTYYACDDSYLTAGTVTIVVGAPRQFFDIFPVRFDPYYVLKLVNTYKHQTFHCTWGPLNSERVTGRATVKPLTTVRINVRLAEFEIDCTGPPGGVVASFGGDDANRSHKGEPGYSANASSGGQAQTRLRSP
jgi:hypothetical protein